MKLSKYQIINELAQNKTVEEIIKNITKGSTSESLIDLGQMIYEDLLMKDEEKIIEMYEKSQINYFITRMILNSINSKTSKYYYLFNRHYNNWVELTYDYEND